MFDCVRAFRIKRLGFDEGHLSVHGYKKLKKYCPQGTAIAAANDLVEDLREIKEEGEIEKIRTALNIHGDALRFLKKTLRPGLSEKSVLNSLEKFTQRRGVAFSFPPIIASGPHSSLPHARVSERRLKSGEPVLIDFGIDFKGYKSDLTRNFFLGKMTPFYAAILDKVRRAQQAALAVLRPGIPAREADRAARESLKRHGLAQFFGHSLGHGVGLEIHEGPRLSPKSERLLKPNMIVTVEPAVYLPDRFGIRVEDMVRVTAKGCEVLNEHWDQ